VSPESAPAATWPRRSSRPYSRKRAAENFSGVASYADFRELLEKQKDLDAVKIMTPDHLHATISIAGEAQARAHAQTALQPGGGGADGGGFGAQDRSCHAPARLARSAHGGAADDSGRRHRKSQRGPQLDRPSAGAGEFRLGPLARTRAAASLSSSYTHAVFRGWYDFGGGSIAEMGNYSLWPIFMALELPVTHSVEAQSSSSSEIADQVSSIKVNDFAFPYANRVCFKFAAHGRWPALKLYWYDGGMRPFTPDELAEDGKFDSGYRHSFHRRQGNDSE
jgi:hypothetical protein